VGVNELKATVPCAVQMRKGIKTLMLN